MARATYHHFGPATFTVRVSANRDSRGYYRIRWNDPATGEPCDAQRRSKQEADQLARDLVELAGLRPDQRARATATVRELADHYLRPDVRANVWAESTAYREEQIVCLHVVPVIGELACAEWTPEASTRVLAAARSRKGSKGSPQTVDANWGTRSLTARARCSPTPLCLVLKPAAPVSEVVYPNSARLAPSPSQRVPPSMKARGSRIGHETGGNEPLRAPTLALPPTVGGHAMAGLRSILSKLARLL